MGGEEVSSTNLKNFALKPLTGRHGALIILSPQGNTWWWKVVCT